MENLNADVACRVKVNVLKYINFPERSFSSAVLAGGLLVHLQF